MSNIEKIDENFKINTNIDKPDIKFYDCRRAPFKIYGIFYEDGKFRRMPEGVAKKVSPGVHALHSNTAGGRLRFKTNSPYIAIKAIMPNMGKMSHFALCGSCGFDLYIGKRAMHTYQPPFYAEGGYEGIAELGTCEMKDITINFPLYSDVSELYIGLGEDSALLPADDYSLGLPVVYYGSSVTQGGCASRASTSYQGFISRELNLDYINLGFSGNARAETQMYNYIKGLSMSLFVYDYDYNAPTSEYLEATHERMFLELREANPELPIILMSMPKAYLNEENTRRRGIVETTYKNAVLRGDKNVYFIDGPTLMALCGEEGLVDTTHPTDLGFFSMAQALIPVIKKALKL